MSYQQPDLSLTYSPRKGYAHFVLYIEPEDGIVDSGLNAMVSIERTSRYVREWQERLRRCEPNSLHTLLVDSRRIPELFHPCVDEDKASPSAVDGSGCVCHRTWTDPEFGLPVVGQHYRTVDGTIDTWTYWTHAPLDLRPEDTFATLVIDRGDLLWIRTANGLLSLLPEQLGRGYGVWRGGSGPAELAQYIQKLIDTDGRDTSADAGRYDRTGADERILSWVSTKDAARTQELTLDDLRRIQHG